MDVKTCIYIGNFTSNSWSYLLYGLLTLDTLLVFGCRASRHCCCCTYPDRIMFGIVLPPFVMKGQIVPGNYHWYCWNARSTTTTTKHRRASRGVDEVNMHSYCCIYCTSYSRSLSRGTIRVNRTHGTHQNLNTYLPIFTDNI